MIEFQKALEIVLESASLLDSESVAIGQSLGRILREDVRADLDMPPFNKSAMDGYACRKTDLGSPLDILEVIPAGKIPEKTIGKSQCSKIMTGARVPEGADCVIMIEYTCLDERGRVRFDGDKTRTNICFQGEDVKAGAVVLKTFTKLSPPDVAVLATFGCTTPLVSKKPRVGILATGDELVESTQVPEACSIRNSNSHQLCAQVLASNAFPAYYGIAKDSDDAIDCKLRQAMAENDVVLISGGVSMGDFDLVPAIMKRNGIEIKFDSIAMKPGKPTHFGVSKEGFCFGLPGNPVSTYIQFEILVKPFLYKLMGHDYQALNFSAVLAEDILVRRSDRESWLPVSLSANHQVVPLEYHGSAHINALGFADGLIVVPIGIEILPKGTVVNVRHI
ncbi:MAG: molybdopterin molybdotransferase MoeA [Deltaproteobacteria bacterium]|nr:molybdopterin molybdotransferase MoeA [Deltaproteobacteria bacterium]